MKQEKKQQYFYVYILRSLKDQKLYVGWTININDRFEEHNQGLVQSTKSRRPLELIYYEVFINKQDALNREKFFKTGWGRRHIQNTLRYTLANEKVDKL